MRRRCTRSRKRGRLVGLERDDELLVVEPERVARVEVDLRVLAADLDVLLHDPPALVGRQPRTTRASSRTGRRTGTWRAPGGPRGATRRSTPTAWSSPGRSTGVEHHFISPLWASTTWNSWMRSRFVACVSSIRSASPRVPTVENARSRRSAAKSSQAARNSRLWAARSLVGQAPPGRIDLQERVLDEVALGHAASGRIGSAELVRPATVRLPEPEPSARSFRMRAMRVALVSPYSWTYPGGVTRHIEALAGELHRRGPRRARARARSTTTTAAPRCCTAARARSARERAGLAGPARRHDRLAVQRRGLEPRAAPRTAVSTLRRELRAGGFDVVHLHEPVAPVDRLGRADVAPTRRWSARSTATRRRVPPHTIADAAGRAAQAQPPDRADRGLRGRRLDRPALLRRRLPRRPQRRRAARRRRARAARARARRAAARSCSSARPSSARACRCCCARSRRCASQVPGELTIVGVRARGDRAAAGRRAPA